MALLPATDPLPLFIIEQGPGGVTITLEKDDAPHGQARDEVAWEEGGELKLGEEGGTYYPGRKRPTYHVMQWRDTARVYHGALRDKFWGESDTKTGAGHATGIRDAILLLAQRGNLCRVTWGKEAFLGLLVKPHFKREDVGDIGYELTFLVAEITGLEQADPNQKENPRIAGRLTDLPESMKSDIAARRAAFTDARMDVTRKTVLLRLIDDVTSALDAVQTAAGQVETATIGRGRSALSVVQRLIAKVADTQARVKLLYTSLQSFDASVESTGHSARDTFSLWGAQADTQVTLLDIFAELRKMRAEAMARVQTNARIYRVRPGDTLEGIAASQLGSRARAGDLGVAARDLVPGQLIQLPLN